MTHCISEWHHGIKLRMVEEKWLWEPRDLCLPLYLPASCLDILNKMKSANKCVLCTKVGVGKLGPENQIWPTQQMWSQLILQVKFYWHTAMLIWGLSVVTFALPVQQTWVDETDETEPMWLTRLKTWAMGSLQKKFAEPCIEDFFSYIQEEACEYSDRYPRPLSTTIHSLPLLPKHMVQKESRD